MGRESLDTRDWEKALRTRDRGSIHMLLNTGQNVSKGIFKLSWPESQYTKKLRDKGPAVERLVIVCSATEESFGYMHVSATSSKAGAACTLT